MATGLNVSPEIEGLDRHSNLRVHCNTADGMENVRRLPCFHTNCDGDLEAQSSAIDIRLYFVSLFPCISYVRK